MFHNRWNMAINATRGNYPNNQSASIFNTRFSDPGQGKSLGCFRWHSATTIHLGKFLTYNSGP